MKVIYKEGGPRRCYHGFGIQLMRDIPASGLYFLFYELIYDAMMGKRWSDPQGVTASLFAGGVAGVLSWAAIMPLDVIKSQVQADYLRERFQGAWSCAKYIYRTQGLAAFGTGFQACAFRAFVVNAVIFAVHKQSLKLLENDI